MKQQKRNSVYVIFLVIIFIFSGCIKTTEKNISYDTSKHKGLLVEVEDSVIYINNKAVQLETPIENWVRILGKYNRSRENDRWDNFYIWDSLGIIVNTYGTRDDLYRKEQIGLVNKVNFHLQGLNSPEGRAGKLPKARVYNFKTYKDSADLLKKSFKAYEGVSWKSDDEIVKHANKRWQKLKKDRDPTKYLYPFNSFKGPLYLNGVPIYSNEKLKPLNDRRGQNELDLFSYIDRSSGPYSWGKDKTGETEEMRDSYHYIAHPAKVSDSIPLIYRLKCVYPKISHITVEVNHIVRENLMRKGSVK